MKQFGVLDSLGIENDRIKHLEFKEAYGYLSRVSIWDR